MLPVLLFSLLSASAQSSAAELRSGVDTVREYFNAHAESPRFVALLSPT